MLVGIASKGEGMSEPGTEVVERLEAATFTHSNARTRDLFHDAIAAIHDLQADLILARQGEIEAQEHYQRLQEAVDYCRAICGM